MVVSEALNPDIYLQRGLWPPEQQQVPKLAKCKFPLTGTKRIMDITTKT